MAHALLAMVTISCFSSSLVFSSLGIPVAHRTCCWLDIFAAFAHLL
jgi:hypothetical protein